MIWYMAPIIGLYNATLHQNENFEGALNTFQGPAILGLYEVWPLQDAPHHGEEAQGN